MFDFSNAAISISRQLLDVSLQATLLLCGASLCALVLRRASAASRHLVWALALVGLIFLPFLNGVTPQRKAFVESASTPMAQWFLIAPAASSGETQKLAPPARAEAASTAAPKEVAQSRGGAWIESWPLLALSVWTAIGDALSSLPSYAEIYPQMELPATQEEVLRAIEPERFAKWTPKVTQGKTRR